VIDLHGAKILVQSEPQKGSTFSIILAVRKGVREKGGGRIPEKFTNN
jgi:signal transduction histidine kinase